VKIGGLYHKSRAKCSLGLEVGSFKTRQFIRKGTIYPQKANMRSSPEFAGFFRDFRGFRAELAYLASFGSPYQNVAT
jgi:hypothetical protein